MKNILKRLVGNNRTRSGAVLALVVIVLLLIGLTGLSLLGIGKHTRLKAVNATHNAIARCAADATVVHAQYLALKAYKTLPWPGVPAVANVPLDGTDATYSYTLTGVPSTGITIEGIGRCIQNEKRVYCRMIEKADLVGIGAEGTIDFQQNFVAGGRGAVLRTNASGKGVISIKTSGTGTVVADLVVGPGANLSNAIDLGRGNVDQVKHNGTKSVAEERVDYPPVVVPQYLIDTPKTAASNIIPPNTTTPIHWGDAGSFTVKAPNNVSVFIEGNLNVGNQSDVIVEAGAKLTLFVDGNITGNNGVCFMSNDNSNPVAVASSILIYGTNKCTVVNLKNGAASYALLYVPSANVEFYNNATLYGAIIVNTITAKNNAAFYYIPELRDILNVPAKKLFVDRWWE